MSAARRLLLFDLDGTLVDSVADIADALDAALAALGRPPLGAVRVRDLIGDGAARLIHRALTGTRDGEAPAAVFEAAYAGFAQAYGAALFCKSRVYPGVPEVLEALAATGWTLAVITNKPRRFTLPLLEQADLARHFALVVAGDTLPRKKPDPLPITHVASALGCDLARTLMVGDSATDIAAARAAAVPAVAVSYGYAGGRDLAAEGADRVIDDFRKLPRVVAELAAAPARSCDNRRL